MPAVASLAFTKPRTIIGRARVVPAHPYTPEIATRRISIDSQIHPHRAARAAWSASRESTSSMPFGSRPS